MKNRFAFIFTLFVAIIVVSVLGVVTYASFDSGVREIQQSDRLKLTSYDYEVFEGVSFLKPSISKKTEKLYIPAGQNYMRINMPEIGGKTSEMYGKGGRLRPYSNIDITYKNPIIYESDEYRYEVASDLSESVIFDRSPEQFVNVERDAEGLGSVRLRGAISYFDRYLKRDLFEGESPQYVYYVAKLPHQYLIVEIPVAVDGKKITPKINEDTLHEILWISDDLRLFTPLEFSPQGAQNTSKSREIFYTRYPPDYSLFISNDPAFKSIAFAYDDDKSEVKVTKQGIFVDISGRERYPNSISIYPQRFEQSDEFSQLAEKEREFVRNYYFEGTTYEEYKYVQPNGAVFLQISADNGIDIVSRYEAFGYYEKRDSIQDFIIGSITFDGR